LTGFIKHDLYDLFLYKPISQQASNPRTSKLLTIVLPRTTEWFNFALERIVYLETTSKEYFGSRVINYLQMLCQEHLDHFIFLIH